MFATGTGELTDQNVHLLQKALYVEPLHYPLDFNKFPTNGHEYIHQVRREEASYFPEIFKEDAESSTMCFFKETEEPKNTTLSLQQWKRNEANFFSYLAGELNSRKDQLKKNFPQKSFPSVNEEKDWCLFCLGSDQYKIIYAEENPQDTVCALPYLSIVLHLDQEEIVVLLQYMKNWVNVIKMNHDICRWIYSLLACLVKPVDDDCDTFLEDFYDDLLKKSKVCDVSQKEQFHIIMAILKNYFCVKAYQLGPDLDQFLKLC